MSEVVQPSEAAWSTSGREVGRVAALWRYPVKSMAAEPLESVEVDWHGLAGDRRWAFFREDVAGNGFPWLTIRQNPDLNRYRPTLVQPENPNASPIAVRTLSGQELELLDPALVTELGGKVRLIKMNRGIFDTLPLSVMTTRTISGLGSLVGAELDVQRFRPNLLVESTDDAPFPEDAWVGCILRVGGLRMRVDERIKRCAIVNVDPATSQSDPEVLRAIARERQARLGVYGSIVEPGRVSVGDAVVVERGPR